VRICVECLHHKKSGYPFRLNYCGAVTYPQRVDCVTGNKCYVDGQNVRRSIPHPLCSEVNREGECALYQGKKEK
jgi:hypothetical protein